MTTSKSSAGFKIFRTDVLVALGVILLSIVVGYVGYINLNFLQIDSVPSNTISFFFVGIVMGTFMSLFIRYERTNTTTPVTVTAAVALGSPGTIALTEYLKATESLADSWPIIAVCSAAAWAGIATITLLFLLYD